MAADSWIPKRPGWIRDHVPIPELPVKKNPEEQDVAVIILIPRCNRCDSKNVKIYRVSGRVRYYHCLNGCKSPSGGKYSFKGVVQND